MTPAEEWENLAMRIRDVATRGVRLGIRVGETGLGESVILMEQYDRGDKLAAEVRAWALKQVEEAKKPKETKKS